MSISYHKTTSDMKKKKKEKKGKEKCVCACFCVRKQMYVQVWFKIVVSFELVVIFVQFI